MSEKYYPCPLVCVVLFEAHALPFDRYVGPILLLLAPLQRTSTWLTIMRHTCVHLCEGRKGSPQATIGTISGSALVACPAAKQNKIPIKLHAPGLPALHQQATPLPPRALPDEA